MLSCSGKKGNKPATKYEMSLYFPLVIRVEISDKLLSFLQSIFKAQYKNKSVNFLTVLKTLGVIIFLVI